MVPLMLCTVRISRGASLLEPGMVFVVRADCEPWMLLETCFFLPTRRASFESRAYPLACVEALFISLFTRPYDPVVAIGEWERCWDNTDLEILSINLLSNEHAACDLVIFHISSDNAILLSRLFAL